VYSERDKSRALKRLLKNGLNFRATVNELGYPTVHALQNWWLKAPQETVKKNHAAANFRSRVQKVRNHRLECSYEVKMEAIHRCYTLGESPTLVAKELGVSSGAVICNWRRVHLGEGSLKPMKKRLKPPHEEHSEVTETKGEAPKTYEELKKAYEALQVEREKLALERDVLAMTIEILKKDPGVNPEALSNREKVVIVDAMGNQFSRPRVMEHLKLPRSSYYYTKSAIAAADKYADVRRIIRDLFEQNRSAYGYRRIWGELKKLGIRLSEKVVRFLMIEEKLVVAGCKKRRYSSYQGELTPAPENLLERDFHAGMPNEKWLTDITEFSIPAGRVYLSPIVDCFDGLVVAWSLGTSPNSELTNSSLKKAIGTLKKERPIIHSDRGVHYRWTDWIHLTTKNKLVRSMSKKGCSPDNAACEGFFGRLKNECFYNRSFTTLSTDDFIAYIDDYIRWYNTKRAKQSLGYLSPDEYRQQLFAT
jgi:putative transposase